MALFDSDNLNPEEEIGGFQAGEQGDETFKIHDLDSYPGEMPAAISSDDKPIYDSKSDETLIGESSSDEPTSLEDDDIEDTDEKSGDEQEWNLVDDNEDDIIGSGEDGEDDIDDEDPYKDMFGGEQVEKKDVASKNPALTESPMDDGLKDIINSELERSKSRKKKREEDEASEEKEALEDIPLVQPSGPEGTESNIDLNDIEADKPSNYGLAKQIDSPSKAQQEEDKKDEAKTKKRSAFFWPLIVGAASLLMLGSVIGTWYYLQGEKDQENYRLYLSMRNFGLLFDVPQEVDSVAWISSKMDELMDDDGNLDMAKVQNYIDGNAISDLVEPSSDSKTEDTSKTQSSLTADNTNQALNQKTDNSLVTASNDNPFRTEDLNPNSEIDSYIKNQNELRSPIPKSSPKSTAKQNQSNQNSDNKNPFRDNSNKNSDEAAKSVVKQIETDNNTKKTPPVNKPIENKTKDIAEIKSPEDLLETIRKRQSPDELDNGKKSYTVQVFSTLSREDAELWKVKLDNRKVGKAYISEHVIRDQTWYRVRVGDYSSREEALKIARRLGYSQVWVDRVK